MTKGATTSLLRYLDENGVEWPSLFSGNAGAVFESVGVRSNVLQDMDLGAALFRAREEVTFMEKHNIEPLFFLDDNYPLRLAETGDAPIVLYKLGNADLDNPMMLSIVGTRKATARGLAMTRDFVHDFSEAFPGMCIVSGLAHGIDSAAHIAALESGLPTVGVLAHGLQMIYPSQHRDLARKILAAGGALLSEYPSGTKPYRGHFLERNRIVAGISDVTLVMESGIKGGAMSTARCADEYNRSVVAVPGRPSDKESEGCNALIRRHRAEIFVDASQLSDITGWTPQTITPLESKSLFPELDGDNKRIYEYVYACDSPCHFEDIHQQLSIPVSQLMALLSELEFDGIMVRHPGNRYSVLK